MFIKFVLVSVFCLVVSVTAVFAQQNSAQSVSQTDIQVFVNRPLIFEITKLTEPEQAILAGISAEYNTGCEQVNCALTTALKLGEQCSVQHKQFLNKWYGQDKIQCQYAPDGAPTYQVLKTFILNRQRENVWNGYLKYVSVEQDEPNKCFFQKRSIILVSGVLVQVVEQEEECPDSV